MHAKKIAGRLRIAAFLSAGVILSACGLGELGASAAAGGASKAEEAREAQNTQDKVRERLDAAAEEARRRREEMEAQTQ